MKKLKMLITFLFMVLTAFSQKDTSNVKVCFPISTAKQIVKDLLVGDSAKEQLKITEIQLIQLEKKINLQDSTIKLFREKEKNYLSVIDSEKNKNKEFTGDIESLRRDLEKEQKSNKIKRITNTLLIVGYTILLVIK